MGTFASSEDPDEMPQNVTFYQGMHCQKKKFNIFGSYDL